MIIFRTYPWKTKENIPKGVIQKSIKQTLLKGTKRRPNQPKKLG